MLEFRKIKKEEIEARVMRTNQLNTRLLLYVDARVCQEILDETVGTENWKKELKEIKGAIACGVGIYDIQKEEYIFKWDVGQSQDGSIKGDVSDAFKRACVNWGIAKELYSTPTILVENSKLNFVEKNGKMQVVDTFTLADYAVEDNKITRLVIQNQNKKIIYSWKKGVKNEI